LWIDQPAGVGFSYGQETDANEEMISEDAYYFLQAFFQTYVQYQANPLFIVGESYGGHYAPAIAHRVWRGNHDLLPNSIKLNLSGLGVGNGLTNPEVQYRTWLVLHVLCFTQSYQHFRFVLLFFLSFVICHTAAYVDMATSNSHGISFLDDETISAMEAVVPHCVKLIHQCNSGDSVIATFACQAAFLLCNAGLTSPYQMTGLNPYDIRKPCEVPPLCYDFSYIQNWLNEESTKQALHVDEKHSHSWSSCNFGINMKFRTDWMKDFSGYVADMLNDGIPALIYAGDVDFICNYLGNKAWTEALQWNGAEAFNAAPDHEWNGVGLAKTAENFTFLQVYDAGHMVRFSLLLTRFPSVSALLFH
jgi:cathepsin A (carboxypeptidase C)